MKICIADDELVVRESIITKLSTLFPLAEIFDVEFGCLALKQIIMVQPDLVFMDIRMPEMDGLEILKQLRQECPNIPVAMLSGYDDFEYARKALQLGAVDYLLKPADREQLRAIVERVQRERESMFLKEIEEHLGKLSSQYVFINPIRCFNPRLWFDNREAKEIRFYESSSECELAAVNPGDVLFTFSVNSDYSGIVSRASIGHSGKRFHEKQQFVQVILEEIEKWESVRFWGDQNVNRSKAHFIHSYAKEAAQSRLNILSFAKAGNYTSLETAVTGWLEYLPHLDLGKLKKECINLMALLDEGLASKNEVVFLEEEKLHYWSRWVDKHKTWDELKDKILKFVLGGIRELMLLETQANASWFEQALRGINTSRDPNISLESVADSVGVHPVTLSRMFKQQTGMTFVRYLVNCRLKQAAAMLLATDKKFEDISEEIGYIDYRYFRSLFKKEFGMSPTDYRKGAGALIPATNRNEEDCRLKTSPPALNYSSIFRV
ncbi:MULTISPECIES: response regulator transcription factor [unclassified Paenibacillus]|uniref:response regulator transcription factor n=1 Tax=unclassified Paenibacillus TaxID=185978 RepID=UPI00363F5B57